MFKKMFRTKPTRRLGSAGTHVYVLFTRFITLARTKSKLLRHYSIYYVIKGWNTERTLHKDWWYKTNDAYWDIMWKLSRFVGFLKFRRINSIRWIIIAVFGCSETMLFRRKLKAVTVNWSKNRFPVKNRENFQKTGNFRKIEILPEIVLVPEN